MFKFCDFNKNEKVNCNSSKQTKGISVLNIKLLKLFAIFVILFVSTSIVKNVFAYFTNYTNEITNNFTMIAEKDLTYNYHLLDNNSLLQDSHTESVRVGENIVLDSSKIINDEHYTFVKFKVGETEYSLDDVFVMPGHDAVIDEYYVGNYTITYVLNGGTNHSSNPSGFTMLDTINLLSPEREHYVFKGWYEAEDFSGSKITQIKNRVGNITLYAKWEPTQYTVTIHHYEIEDGVRTQNRVANDEIIRGIYGSPYTTRDLIPTLDGDGNIIEQDGRSYLNKVKFTRKAVEGEETGEITENIEIKYYYEITKYEITGEAGLGGVLEGKTPQGNMEGVDERVKYGQNSKKEIVITPDAGNKVDDVLVNGVKVRGYRENKETKVVKLGVFTNVLENKHIQVTFEPIPMVAKIIKVPEGYESLLNTEYEYLEYAINAIPENMEGFTIQIINEIENETNFIENKYIEIDLNGYEVYTYDRENANITVKSGSLKVIDNNKTTGKIINEWGKGIEVKQGATFTLGEDEEEGTPNQFPCIEATGSAGGSGVVVEEGAVFNFYDGKIRGRIAIDGLVTDTPRLYDPTSTDVDGKKQSVLAKVAGIEALIGKTRYPKLEQAINAANNIKGTPEDEIEIDLAMDITKAERLIADNTKNIILDLNGFVLTTTANDYILENQGKMQIIDSSRKEATDEEEAQEGTGKIRSTTYSAMLNSGEGKLIIKSGEVTTTASNLRGIVSNGTSEIIVTENGKVSGTAGIRAEDEAKITISGGEVSSSSGAAVLIHSTCNVNIIGGKIKTESGWGIYNYTSATITIENGDIYANSGYGICNDLNGKVSIKDSTVISDSGTTIGNNAGEIIIEESNIINNGGSRKEAIYSYGAGKITIKSGTIEGNSGDGRIIYASAGQLDILNGIFNQKGSWNEAIYTGSDVVVNIQNGEFNISGYNAKFLNNSGELNITGGTYLFSNYEFGYNYGTLKIKDVTINTYTGIYNGSSANVELENVIINARSNYTISNNRNTNILIKNCTLNNTGSYGIQNNDNSTCTILESTINSYRTAINNSGIVILGEKESNELNIIEITSTDEDGIVSSGSGKLYYYDGTIKGNTAISGIVQEIKENTYIDLSNEEGKEIAELKPLEYVASVTNENVTDKKFTNLQDAINECSNVQNSQITILKNITIDVSSKLNVENNQDITINLNGNKITSFADDYIIKNEGELKVIDLSDEKESQIISRNKTIFNNSGTLELTYGTYIINKANIYADRLKSNIIDNTGNVILNNTKLKAYGSYINTIYNKEEGTVEISNIDIDCTCDKAIYNDSTEDIIINNCNIVANCDQSIYNNSTGKIQIKGEQTLITSSGRTGTAIYNNIGAIEFYNGIIDYDTGVSDGTAIDNINGNIKIFGGEIKAASRCINNSEGEVIISGGNFKSYQYTSRYDCINNTYGSIIILGGRIETPGGCSGVYNNTGTIILGLKDGDVSTESPYIYTEGSAGYAIRNYNGTFKFYDGILESKESKSISGNISDVEEEYNIKYLHNGDSSEISVDSGREKVILMQTKVARVESSGEEYSSLENALENIQDTDTITIIDNIKLTNTASTLILPATKDLKIDLSGYKIELDNTLFLRNNGSLEILDSSNAKTGNITSTGKVFINENILKLFGGTINGANTIDNNGDLYVREANITTSSTYIISNNSQGNITVTSGNLYAYYTIINSNSTGEINISGGNLYSTGGSSCVTINAYNSEVINITGGSIGGNNIIIGGNAKLYIHENITIDSSITMSESSYLETNGANITDNISMSDSSTAKINQTTGKKLNHNGASGEVEINGSTFSKITNTTLDMKINDSNITENELNESSAIYNSGVIEIKDSTIKSIWNMYTGGGYGIENRTGATVKIDGGSVYGDTEGIKNYGTLIVGKDDGEVVSTPVIIGKSNRGIENKGTLKIYDGIIKGNEYSFNGVINEIAEDSVLLLTKEGNIQVATLGTDLEVAQIGDVTYPTMKKAFEVCTDNVNTDIKIIADFAVIETDKMNILEEKDVNIDLNGHMIMTFASGTAITNNGKLKLQDSSEQSTGKIISLSDTILTNLGTLEITGGTYTSTTNTNYLIINNGGFTLTDGTITVGKKAIYNNTEEDFILNGGNINGNNSSSTEQYLIYNNAKNITINNVNINASNYAKVLYNATGCTIEMNLGNIISSGEIYNYGTFIMNNGEMNISSSIYNYEIFTMNNGEISCSNAMYNNGTLTVNNGNINMTVLYNGSNSLITLKDGLLKSTDYGIYNYGGNSYVNIEGGRIEANSKAIYNSGSNGGTYRVTITGGTIISENDNALYNAIYNWSVPEAIITGGTLQSNTKTAIYNAATLTIGEDDMEIPNKLTPEIIGKTYGVENYKTFNFYDGVITGETLAISGEVTDTPEGFGVVKENNDTKATLGIDATFENVIQLNGIYYNSLASAVSAINDMSSKKGTIKLNGDILLKHQLEIPTGTNVTLEMQGYSITYDKDEVAIVNNGTLTIVDFTDGESSLETGEQSLVRNSVGTAIENNGTLTLGIDDATYNANSPVVQGGITGTAAVIYDGKVINN